MANVRSKTGLPMIDDYANAVISGKIVSCKRLKAGVIQQVKRLRQSGVVIDKAKAELAVELIEDYFDFKLLPWQKYIIGLAHCYNDDDTVVFNEFLIVMGRGNGKTKFIAALSWYFTTATYGIKGYNVDIVANSEDQAKLAFEDVYEMLGTEWPRVKDAYTRTKKLIYSNSTGSYIKYNTSNARTKDGKRSACLIFDEEHEYETSDNIRVFTSGFGKRKHSRIFKITTRGYVMDGVLDHDLKIADQIIEGKIKTVGMAVLIYEADNSKDVENPEAWEKANPSIAYFPELMQQMEAELEKLKYDSSVEQEFYTKRMNLPKVDREMVVATRKELMATAREMPDLTGLDCVCGIDYAMLSDMASAGLLFRIGDTRYYIQHSWICRSSNDWNRIRAPLEEWEQRGDLTIVEGPQIDPVFITDWMEDMAQQYNIVKVAVDTARFALMREALSLIGYEWGRSDGNIYLVRPLGIASVSPVIESWFRTESIVWGDVPLMRWAANNTKKVRMRTEGASGNYKYDKIEPRSRKTDPFMAFVHAATQDAELVPVLDEWVMDLPAATD